MESGKSAEERAHDQDHERGSAPPSQPDGEHAAAPQPGTREYLDAVRQAAGFRVSPRQLAAALEAFGDAEQPTPQEAAAVVSASQGDVSQRQRRHGDYWRALGAYLTVQGDDGSPAGQRAFIGAARAAARRDVSDLVLLQVATGIAAMDRRLHAEVVGRVSRWITRQHGSDLTVDEITSLLPAALQATTAEQRARRRATTALARGRAGSSSTQQWSQSAGRRPRGSSYGGKRRRRSAPPPQSNTDRRASPR